MDNQPSFDRSILIPIGVGIFSLIGICVVLVMGRVNASRATVEEVPTATPFKYSLIGTEPAVAILTIDGFTESPVTVDPTFRPPETVVALPTNTIAAVVPLITLPSTIIANTPTRTPASASTAPLNAGTYDDTDSHIVYSGNWISQSGVSGLYQDSLHVSNTLGNTMTFTFIGQQVRLFYQQGTSLGNFTLKIDNNDPKTYAQSSGSTIFELASDFLTTGTHTVLITHASGGSINFDKIIIPEIILTPVPPTPTSTTNPNQ